MASRLTPTVCRELSKRGICIACADRVLDNRPLCNDCRRCQDTNVIIRRVRSVMLEFAKDNLPSDHVWRVDEPEGPKMLARNPLVCCDHNRSVYRPVNPIGPVDNPTTHIIDSLIAHRKMEQIKNRRKYTAQENIDMLMAYMKVRNMMHR